MSNTAHVDPKGLIDVVLTTIHDGSLHVALSPREHEPERGALALVGGFVDPELDETLDDTVERILTVKAGLTRIYFEQLYTFGGKARDPARGFTISVTYLALVPEKRLVNAMEGTRGVTLRPIGNPGRLPFDHVEIVACAAARLRGKGAWSVLPAHLLGPTFSMAELHRVYQEVLGESLHYANFRRKISEIGLFEEAGTIKPELGKPHKSYRIRKGATTADRRI